MLLGVLAPIERLRDADTGAKGQRLADVEAKDQRSEDQRSEGQRLKGQRGSESKSGGFRPAESGLELEDK